jgi:tRNA-splicing ligase RtcB
MKQFKIYGKNIEESALNQFYEAMKQDFVVKGALMPDTHQGYTLPIGAVIATKDIIVPSYVGQDAGCGVCAYKTKFHKSDIEKFTVKDFSDTMKDVEAKVTKSTLDESPMAYKNIFDVMDLQSDLVDIITRIKPIINIKG